MKYKYEQQIVDALGPDWQPPDTWTVTDKLRFLAEHGFTVTINNMRLHNAVIGNTHWFVVEAHVCVVGTEDVCNSSDLDDEDDYMLCTWAVGSCPVHSARWALAEEFAPDAAQTRAIGRALNIMMPRLFAYRHMGNEDEIQSTVDSLIERIHASTTPTELNRLQTAVQDIAKVCTKEQKAAILEAWRTKVQSFKNQ